MPSKNDIIRCLISGILIVLSFPPFDLYPFAWVSLVPLLVSSYNSNYKRAFSSGFICGLVYFVGTVYWVYHSMYFYGNIPLPISFLIMIILSGYLALYTGTFSLVFNFLRNRTPIPSSILVPLIWISLEYLRTYALTGFPWALMGYSQYRFLRVIQISDLTGIYGVSFIITAFNGLIFDIYLIIRKWHKFNNWKLSFMIGTIFTLLIICFTLIYGSTRLASVWNNGRIRISIVQGNIPQEKKWDRRYQKEVFEKYITLTETLKESKPDIIIWPESALPFPFGYNQILTKRLIEFQKKQDSYLLFGTVLVRETLDSKPLLTNSVVLLAPDGEIVSTYDKIHLVPYGEYVPLQRLFPFIHRMVTAIGDFTPGKDIVIMRAGKAKIGNLICYEIIFPGLVRKFVKRGANLIVTVTNDAWFGRTSAPYQHFTTAVFRAVENRVPIARAANTGISGFIDPFGRMIQRSGIFVDALLTQDITLGRGNTFYARHGDIFSYICIGLLMMTFLITYLPLFADSSSKNLL